ncbi:MAG: hypothetical protein KDI56_10090 [Xanthomonadales bacterium]|nr:hypothetical protein [Xanthomonadales bacterium]MCB1629521.1 hypothetical protein [Xanthomonadales bacterium]
MSISNDPPGPLDVDPELVRGAIALMSRDWDSAEALDTAMLEHAGDAMLVRRLRDWIPEIFGLVLVARAYSLNLPTTFQAKTAEGQWLSFEFKVEPLVATAGPMAAAMLHAKADQPAFQKLASQSSTMVVIAKAEAAGVSPNGGSLAGPALIGVPADIYLPPRQGFWQRLFGR